MRAGRLRHQIQLQSRSTTTGFEPSETWTTYATVWAARLEPRGNELIKANVSETQLNAVFHIRHRTDVSPTHRVLFGTRVFDIRGVTNPDGRDRTLHLTCVERETRGG